VAYRDYSLGIVKRYGLNPRDPAVASALRDAGILEVQLAHVGDRIARMRRPATVLRLLGIARKLRGQRMALERDLAKLAAQHGVGQGDTLEAYLAQRYSRGADGHAPAAEQEARR
jgi:hypothetical protein